MNRNPILINLPTQIHTSRLLLRQPRPGDGVMVNASIKASFAELHRWLPWADHEPTIDESEIYVRMVYAEWITNKSQLPFLILSKDGKTHYGSTGFNMVDWKRAKVEIGYWICTEYAGQGYITEAVNALTRYAVEVLGATRIQIKCDEENERSAKVPQRLGYVLEGILKNDNCVGKARNTMLFARYDLADLPSLAVSYT